MAAGDTEECTPGYMSMIRNALDYAYSSGRSVIVRQEKSAPPSSVLRFESTETQLVPHDSLRSVSDEVYRRWLKDAVDVVVDQSATIDQYIRITVTSRPPGL